MTTDLRAACAIAAVFAAPAMPAAAEPAPTAVAPPEDVGRVIEGLVIHPPADSAEVKREAHNFVSAVTRPAYGQAISRWSGAICPMVAGVTARQGEFMLTRLTEVASLARVPVAAKGCRPNLIIVLTPTPEPLLRAWRTYDVTLFGGQYPAKVKRFLSTERPVRIWYNTSVEGTNGRPISADPGEGLPRANFTVDSRLVFNAAYNLQSVIVIVDTTRARGLKFDQLTDYIAVAGMTQVDQDVDYGAAPTILRLFADKTAGVEAPMRATDWDKAFIKTLYRTDQGRTLQRASIAREVARTPKR